MFVALPPAIHVDARMRAVRAAGTWGIIIIRRLAASKANTMTAKTWKDSYGQEALIDIAKGVVCGGKHSLLTMFPNHGWCTIACSARSRNLGGNNVGADDPERLLENLVRDFGGGWN